mmetsp:Transcript_312/g.569  ORF Transcript_312/g.569 Transcript_312/m.569 type:complete len:411 (+) Transcript_312:108-1340(+)
METNKEIKDEETEGEYQVEKGPVDTYEGVDEDELEIINDSTKSIIMELMKQVKPGMDLSRVMIPVDFLEPQSLLERITVFCSTMHILRPAVKEEQAEERIKHVSRWYLSGWHIKPPGVKKPYNPILGEICRGTFDMNEKIKIRPTSFNRHKHKNEIEIGEEEGAPKFVWFAEQVSHHPPISGFYGEMTDKSIIIEGWYYPKSKFLGNSASSEIKGIVNVTFPELKETYVITWPAIYARGIIFGKLIMEVGGNCTIKCVKTGYNALINFKTKPLFGGAYNLISGKIKAGTKTIHKIKGNWTRMLTITNQKTKKSSLFLDVKSMRYLPMKLPENLQPNESSVVWNDLTKAVLDLSLEKAQQAKYEVEEAQREKRRRRLKKKSTWIPRYFKPGPEEFWFFKGKDSELYRDMFK